MFMHNGISVNAWVVLDGSCRMDMECSDDSVTFECGPHGTDFGLELTEEAVDKIAGLLAQAQQHFRDLDAQQTAPDAAAEAPEAEHVAVSNVA